MEEIKEFIKINYIKGKAHAKLYVSEFSDNGYTIIFNQTLNLSAYGSTSIEAKKMFVEVVVHDFFENLFKLSESEIFSFLKKLGWKRSTILKRELSNTAKIDREGILRDFNLSDETQINGALITV